VIPTARTPPAIVTSDPTTAKPPAHGGTMTPTTRRSCSAISARRALVIRHRRPTNDPARLAVRRPRRACDLRAAVRDYAPMTRKLRVLVACEYSGRVRDAFRALGHEAISCDLLPTEATGPHMQVDALTVLHWDAWDLVIAHPPCTYLCNSGVRWLSTDPARWAKMRDAAVFFMQCLSMPKCPVAVENPVMHGHANIRKPDFTVQPWQFGDPAKKRTCFWTRGLPPLRPTSDMTAADAKPDCHHASPGPDRWKERSRTYHGMAAAIARQWSAHILQAEIAL